MADETDMVLGFDLGGTKMLACVVSADGEIVSREKTKVDPGDSDAVFSDMIKTIEKAIDEAGIKPKELKAAGVAVPGPADLARGVVIATPNLPFRDFPLRDKLQKEFPFPVLLENDVNAGLYGEFRQGAARGFKHVVGVFPGTGIGGALVLDGKLYRGARGSAGEVGHMVVQPGGGISGTGQRGTLEALAARGAIARELAFLAGIGKAPTVFSSAGTDIRAIRSGTIRDAWDAGEAAVREAVEHAAEIIGIALANLIAVLDPELIVLGGGLVEKLENRLIAPIKTAIIRHGMPALVPDVQVRAAELGDYSVIHGAAALARENA